LDLLPRGIGDNELTAAEASGFSVRTAEGDVEGHAPPNGEGSARGRVDLGPQHDLLGLSRRRWGWELHRFAIDDVVLHALAHRRPGKPTATQHLGDHFPAGIVPEKDQVTRAVALVVTDVTEPAVRIGVPRTVQGFAVIMPAAGMMLTLDFGTITGIGISTGSDTVGVARDARGTGWGREH
jgi:hypothetical protein